MIRPVNPPVLRRLALPNEARRYVQLFGIASNMALG